MNEHRDERSYRTSVAKPGKRKKYQSPRLTNHGTVAKLTNGGAPSANSDHGNNSMRP